MSLRQLKISQSITKRESQSIEKYLHEIGKVDLISADDEVKLAKRIKQGDQLALQQLVKANLRFVVSVAKQYQNNYLSLNDLINEGNLGLLKAAQRFDETKGFKFISYAVWWIRQSIIQAVAEQSRVVRLPLNKVGALTRLNKAFSDLEQKFEREPTHDELAEGMELATEQIVETLRIAPGHLSMDAPLVDGENKSLIDVLEDTQVVKGDENMVYTDSLRIDTERVLTFLSERQQLVIKMFYGIGNKEPMSHEEIGEHLGLSRERIIQIKDRALCILRSSSSNASLKEYLCQ